MHLSGHIEIDNVINALKARQKMGMSKHVKRTDGIGLGWVHSIGWTRTYAFTEGHHSSDTKNPSPGRVFANCWKGSGFLATSG